MIASNASVVARSGAASDEDRVETVTSPGGITAWLVEDHTNPIIAMTLGWHGGAAQDPLERGGLTNLLCSLLDEGAGDLVGPAFREALQDEAIQFDSSAFQDSVRLRMTTLSAHRGRAFDLLSLAVTRPRYDAAAVARVGAMIVGMLKSQAQDPNVLAHDLFCEKAFPRHAYARPTTGTVAVLPSIQRDELLALHGRILARDNLKITVVGAIGAAELGARLDDAFGRLPTRAELMEVDPIVVSGLGSRHVMEVDGPQSTIRFGRPGLSRGDPDLHAATLVNHCFGGGSLTSRLFRELREARGLCYGVATQNATFARSAMFGGAMSTKNERAAEALTAIEAEFARLSDKGLDADDLDAAKSFLCGSYALNFDTSRRIADNLLAMQIEGHGPDRMTRYTGLLEAVDLDQANHAARRLVGDGSLLVAITGRPTGL